MPKNHSLRDAYRHPGFVPAMTVRVDPDIPEVYVLPLRRRSKKRSVARVGFPLGALTTTSFVSRVIWIAALIRSSWSSTSAVCIVHGVA
jgi:hypothetical protein